MKLWIFVTITLSILASQTFAEKRALLIGVTGYTAKVTQMAGALKGPGPDVGLMATVFGDAGVSDIDILTDAPEHLPANHSASPPTLANIVAALDRLAQTATPGDDIAIYIAGHGAQVPATDDHEPDGLDEVFLPADFAIGPDGQYQNMLRDDDIGARIDQMIAAGANVWLIADTCHSGSLRRSSGALMVPRLLSLASDGIQITNSEHVIDLAEVKADRPGNFVGFYAAAAGALAYETQPPGTETTHGLLTWALAHAARDGQASNYTDLARLVSAQLWQIGQGLAQPDFTGGTGARHMLSNSTPQSGAFGVEIGDAMTINAGRLDGVIPGATLRVERADGTALFDATVQHAGLTTATAQLPQGEIPALDAQIRRDGLDPTRFRSRWLSDRAPTLRARIVARPIEAGVAMSLAIDELPSELQARVRDVVAGLTPMLRLDPSMPEAQVVSADGRIFLRPAPAGAAHALQVPADREGVVALHGLLRRMAKARGLLTATQALKDTELAQNLTIGLTIATGRAQPDGTCATEPTQRSVSLSEPLPPIIRHCDNVALHVHNDNAHPVDLTTFYAAPDHQVYFLSGYTGAQSGGWRIAAGGQSTLHYTEATRAPDGSAIATGQMHVLIFATHADPAREPVDFRYLQDASPPPLTRSDAADDLGRVLREVGFGLVKTRSIGEGTTADSGAISIPLRTVPDDVKVGQGDD